MIRSHKSVFGYKLTWYRLYQHLNDSLLMVKITRMKSQKCISFCNIRISLGRKYTTKHACFFCCFKMKHKSQTVSLKENYYMHNNGATLSKILSTKVGRPKIIPATNSANPESILLYCFGPTHTRGLSTLLSAYRTGYYGRSHAGILPSIATCQGRGLVDKQITFLRNR